jgi:hypothetical protein
MRKPVATLETLASAVLALGYNKESNHDGEEDSKTLFWGDYKNSQKYPRCQVCAPASLRGAGVLFFKIRIAVSS